MIHFEGSSGSPQRPTLNIRDTNCSVLRFCVATGSKSHVAAAWAGHSQAHQRKVVAV